MTLKTLNPYIMLNGKAEQAIARYQEALGATLVGPIMRYGDVPGHPAPAEHAKLVMHARLEVNGLVLMVSDARPDHPVAKGSDVSIMLEFDDVDHTRRVFDQLAEGGEVSVALHDTFWGATFGALDDAFGVSWMFNCPKPDAGR